MPRVHNKKIKKIIQSAWHICENVQLAGLGGYSKTKKNLQGRNLTKKFYRGENQK